MYKILQSKIHEFITLMR